MNSITFDLTVKERLEKCLAILTAKAEGYASDDDRLHNFHVAAAALGISREQVLLCFWFKHVVSLIDMIKSGREYPAEMWDEKIGDAICYLLIWDAMVKEKNRM